MQGSVSILSLILLSISFIMKIRFLEIESEILAWDNSLLTVET
jgi:hypothetical protein